METLGFKVRYWVHAIIWAVWVDLNQPKCLLPLLKWINNERVKRFEI